MKYGYGYLHMHPLSAGAVSFLKKRHRECKTNTGGSQLHQRLLVIRPIDCDTGNGCTKPNPKEYLHKDD